MQNTMDTVGATAIRVRGRRSVGAAVALVALVAMVGCVPAPAPEAVLYVPGTYTANLWEPGGSNAATVLMCLDEASAVHLDNPPGSPGLGIIRLRWSSGEYSASGPDALDLTTPLIPAGCGLLTFGVDCCHVDEFLTIRAEKAPHI